MIFTRPSILQELSIWVRTSTTSIDVRYVHVLRKKAGMLSLCTTMLKKKCLNVFGAGEFQIEKRN